MGISKRSISTQLRVGALFLALILVMLFQITAARRPPPLVAIGEIKPFMNFSTVQVDGILEQEPLSLGNGSLLLLVNDGSGTLPVFLEDAPAKTPLPGSRIIVSGTVAAGARHNLRMSVDSLDSMQIEAGATLGGIGLEMLGESVTVSGRVVRVWDPPASSRAPHRIILSDGHGTLEVVHWLGSPIIIHVRDLLEVTGTLELYKGRLQLKLRDAGDLRILNGT